MYSTFLKLIQELNKVIYYRVIFSLFINDLTRDINSQHCVRIDEINILLHADDFWIVYICGVQSI